MKKILVILSVIMLTACASAGKNMSFPEVPDDLKKVCPDLAQVDPSTSKLSDVLTVVTTNYSQYYECKERVDTWIEWYTHQKEIFNSVK